jgi:hypothetical protein
MARARVSGRAASNSISAKGDEGSRLSPLMRSL